jgi:hypothetical protein
MLLGYGVLSRSDSYKNAYNREEQCHQFSRASTARHLRGQVHWLALTRIDTDRIDAYATCYLLPNEQSRLPGCAHIRGAVTFNVSADYGCSVPLPEH